MCTLALSTIPDDRAAVSERDGCSDPEVGSSCSSRPQPVAIMRLLQRLLSPLARRFEGDHLLGERLDHVSGEGFEIERLLRSKLGWSNESWQESQPGGTGASRRGRGLARSSPWKWT